VIVFSEVFLSELVGLPVVDRDDKRIGIVRDVLAQFGDQYPRVTGVVVKRPKDLPLGVVVIGDIDVIGRRMVLTRNPAEHIAIASLRQNDVLMARDIMDKQIVDVDGARVVRVNDVKLARMEGEVRVIAADVGILGMLRRLKLLPVVRVVADFFRIPIPDRQIGWNYVELLEDETKRAAISIPHSRIGELHPSDVAHIMSQLASEKRQEIFAALPDRTAAESLHELEPKIQAYLLTTISSKKALALLDRMPVDEIADVLGDIPFDRSEELLRLMKPRKVAAVRKLLQHSDESAGGLMTTDCIKFPEMMTADQAIQKLRELAPSTETIYYLYVVDEEERLRGILSLRNLIISAPDTLIRDIMKKHLITVTADVSQRKVADVISKYNLLAIPVVDAENRIQGIITVDDVMDYILPPISRRKREMLG